MSTLNATNIKHGSSGTNNIVLDLAGNVEITGSIGVGTSNPAGVLDVGAVGGAVTAGDLTVTTGSTTAEVIVGRLSSTSNDNTTFKVRDRVDRDLLTVDGNNLI